MRKNMLDILAVLSMASVIMVSCMKEARVVEAQKQIDEIKTYTMTVDATKDSQTKGLEFSGTGALNVKWNDTDQVSVFPEAWSDTYTLTPMGALTAVASTDGSTTISGDVTGSPTAGDNLHLLFPRAEWNYSGQKGILLADANSIEKKYDYALADVTIDEVDGSTITTTAPAAFQSQQAIVKFNIKNKATDAAINVTALKISANGGKLVQGREMISPTPEGYEAVTGPANYLYIELSEKAGDMMDVTGNDYVNFKLDDAFGTGGYKEVGGGKYLYRFKTNESVSQIVSVQIESDSEPYPSQLVDFYAYGSVSPIDFTNGMYLRQNGSHKVDVVDLAGTPVLTSVYGSLTITPDASTNELTVALRNELAAADTYQIWASDGVNGYMLTSPSIEFVNGKYYEITLKMTQEPAYYAATADDIGKVIGVDGNIYDNVAAANASSTAVAMIAYVGNASNCAHGLAIALNDVTKLTWANALTTAAAQTPAVFGGSWRLPSMLDWQYMFVGCGQSGTPSTSYLSICYAAKLVEKLNAAGVTPMQYATSNNGYWMSNENGTEQARYIKFWSHGPWFVSTDNSYKTNTYDVRACLAF